MQGWEKGCSDEIEPVVMACMADRLGLLPAAVANGESAPRRSSRLRAWSSEE